MDVPPFKLGGSRYNLETFSGRLKHFFDVTDPRTLLTPQSELEKCLKLLQQYKDGNHNCATDEELWKAQKIKQAIIHPDTGEKILMPFRMSGYVPFGTPMVVGAVTSAVSIAVGLNVLVKNASSISPAKRIFIQRFIPFPAVATASVCNVVLMRMKELSTGIEVATKDGTVVGVSKIAAKKALKETAVTRAVLPAPILIIPPIVMSILDRTKWFPRYPRLNLPTQVVVCTLSFGLALPIAIAMFPQFSQINVKDLENEIQENTTHSSLYYNKGL